MTSDGNIDYDSVDMDKLIQNKFQRQAAKEAILTQAKDVKKQKEDEEVPIVFTEDGKIDYDATDMDDLIQNSFKK